VKRPSRAILGVLFVLFVSNTAFSQTAISAKCYTWADNKRIPLFKTLPYLKKELSVYRDIEYPDTLIFLYGYDCKIKKFDKFTITPQLLFFVDTAKKETVKQELYVNIEYGAEHGNITEADLERVLLYLKNNNLPFLTLPKGPSTGSSYKNVSLCCTYDLNISALKDNPASSEKEFVVTVSIVKADNAMSK